MSKNLGSLITSLSLCAALALPIVLSAQEQKKQKDEKNEHHHYKLIVVEPLGGPASSASGPLQKVVNNRGTFAAYANTASPNPNPNCSIPFSPPDCFVEHAVVWHNGTLTDLGTLPGGTNSQGASISASGLIAGFSDNGLIDPLTGQLESVATLWWGRRIISLGTLPGGTESLAFSVNSRGQVVGYSNNEILDPFSMGGFPTQTRAFLWQNRVMTDLGTLGGPDSLAFDVNERGQIAGQSYTNSTPNPTTGLPTQNPFYWENGKMTDLGTLGGTIGIANWMNNRGQVVGNSNVAGDQDFHAFLWDKEEGLKDLGSLPGGSSSAANWINDAGEVVGGSNSSNGDRAVLWKNGAMIDLGILQGDCSSEAWAINSQGQIVGNSSPDCVQDGNAVLWENGGAPINLNTLVLPGSGVTVVFAIDINDRGEIAAHALTATGDPRAVLLIPCDENHPGVEGCDYDRIEAVTEDQVRPAQVTPALSASPVKLSPAEMTTRFHSLMADRNRRFGMPQTSTK